MVALDLVGVRLLVPFWRNTRYDLVIEEEARLARGAVQTGCLRRGAVKFNVCSVYLHHPNRASARNYHGEVDYFAVYCRETTGVYLVPIEDLPMRSSASLRVEPARTTAPPHPAGK